MTDDPVAAENAILQQLGEIWNAFVALPVTHPMERSEMCTAIHQAQNLVGARIVRHYRPDIFPPKA